MKVPFWIFLMLVSGTVARAQSTSRTLHVPADFPTIGAALTNASGSEVDTVLVAPGVYAESVSFHGKNVRVISSDGPAVTWVAPPSNAAAFVFDGGETANAVVSGFTLTNGLYGIYVFSASPTITSNVIVNCHTGIECQTASPVIQGNRIIGSHGTSGNLGDGSGLLLAGVATPLLDGNRIETNDVGITMFAAGNPTIRNNIVGHNRRDGIDMVNQSDASILQNLILKNGGGGISWLVPAGAHGPWVIANTIVDNGQVSGAGIDAEGNDAATEVVGNIIVGQPALYVGLLNNTVPPIIQFNDIYSPTGTAYAGNVSNLTGIAGNVSANPWFACQPAEGFHLLAGSPCIDAGTNGAPMLPAADFDGNPRVLPGTANGVATVDLGAFEFNPASPPVPCLYITCSSNLVVVALPGDASAKVTWPTLSATPVATVTCSPPSGSVLPAGTNLITCTAAYGTNTISCAFTVTVLTWPDIVTEPQSTNVPAGQPFTLSVLATGSAPLSYSWLFAGAQIPGATNSALTITGPQTNSEGAYQVVVTNSAGSVTSSVASVTVIPSPPQIVAGPNDASLPAGETATFTVTAEGSVPFAFQWFKDASVLTGAVESRLVIANAQLADAGAYHLVISNALGTAVSPSATLTVLPALPTFVTQPVGGSAVASDGFTLTAVARGSEPVSYQWRQDGVPLVGAIQSALTLSNITGAAAGPYDVVATNAFGAATSAVAQVTVYPLSEQPQELGQTVNGYQDDFSGPTRNPNWVVLVSNTYNVGRYDAMDHYVQTNGVLQVSVSEGDPNHLVYLPLGGYNTNVQEVLARLRVVAFGFNADQHRCGIAVGVGSNTNFIAPTSDPGGLNLELRDNSMDSNESSQTERKVKFLDDLRAWGPPGLEVTWMNNVWYWMRLRLAPLEDGTNSVFGKVWLADGQTPEPSDWQMRWGPRTFLPAPLRAGYAGITGSSGLGYQSGGLAHFEVSYILIKADGLPRITASWTPIGPPPNPITFDDFTPNGAKSARVEYFGGVLQTQTGPTNAWTTVPNAVSPSPVTISLPTQFWRLEQEEVSLTAFLTGDREVPAVATAETGIGILRFLNKGLVSSDTLQLDIQTVGLTNAVTELDIDGPTNSTANGGVLLSFTNSVPGWSGRSLRRVVVLDSSVRAAILSGQTYLNVKTTVNPGGEIRGQITPVVLRATLGGASEVPPVDTPATGTATLWLVGNVLSWNVTYTNLSSAAVGGEVRGPSSAGANAGLLIPFTLPVTGVPGTSGRIMGSTTITNTTWLGYIVDGVTYVNLDTTNNPAGELRGQIGP